MLDTHLGYPEPKLVTTVQGGQTGIAFPFAPVYESAQLRYVRINLFIQSLSVGVNIMNVEARIQHSDDAVNWVASTAATTAFPTIVSLQAEGVTSNAVWDDLQSLLTKKYARIVLVVKNTAGNTGLATCLATFRLERKTC